MPITRKLHWETRSFQEFLIARAQTPFAWGTNDCALFAADGIQAMTDVDIAADFRGKYSDQAGAFATIKAVCGGATVGDAAAYCAQKHGLTEWAKPLMARRGDLAVFCDDSGAMVAGLVHLNGSDVLAVGEAGVYRFPLMRILRAWHV